MSEPASSPAGPTAAASAIHRLVAASLRQRFLVGLLTALIAGIGVWSFSRLPVDAYPDLSPPMVEISTQWPGHAAEEVERLITVPIEVEMNGLPQLRVIRSISLYGLSDVRMTFEDGTDNYFARQQVFERLPDATLPDGVSPSISPLFSPSGLVYRYVVESPERTRHGPQDHQRLGASPGSTRPCPAWPTWRGWVARRCSTRCCSTRRGSPGPGSPSPTWRRRSPPTTATPAGGFYSEGGQFYYVRGLGRIATTEDIGNIVLANKGGTPVLVKDVGRVVIGHAPRLGQFGFDDRNDAVEGVILMRKGEQAQTVLQGVEAKTRELNDSILSKDVKIRPFYDRSDLVELTTRTVEDNLLRGIVLVVVVLIFFLYDVRSGLIVAATIPLSLLFAFICLDLKDIPANLLSIGAIDFGILVDGAVVMVENIHRQLALRNGTSYNVADVIAAAAAEVDRPIVYAVAVIVAGFLPIYVLSGPSGKLFTPMADTMIFALAGSLLLTLDPPAGAVRVDPAPRCAGAPQPDLRGRTRGVSPRARLVSRASAARPSVLRPRRSCSPCSWARGWAPSSCRTSTRARIWVRATMPYTISFDESAKLVPQIRTVLRSFPEVTIVADEHGRDDDGTDPTGFFNAEFYVGLKPYGEWRGQFHRKQELIDAIDARLEAFPGIIFNFTQPAEDAVDEAETGLKSALDVKVFGSDLETLEKKGKEIKHVLERRPRHQPRDPGPGAGPAEPDRGHRPGEDRALRGQRGRREPPDRGRGRRRRRDPGGAGRAPVRSGGPAGAAVPRVARGDPEHPGADAGGAAGPARRAGRHPGRERGVVHLPREQLALHRDPVLGGGSRPGGRGRGRAPPGGGEDLAAVGVSRRVGRGIPGVHRVAEAAPGRAAAHALPHLSHSLRALQQLQVPDHHRGRRAAVGSRWGASSPWR